MSKKGTEELMEEAAMRRQRLLKDAQRYEKKAAKDNRFAKSYAILAKIYREAAEEQRD